MGNNKSFKIKFHHYSKIIDERLKMFILDIG